MPEPPIRCPQCWKHKPAGEFLTARGARVTWCHGCRTLYRGGGHRETRRKGLAADEVRVGFVRRSANRKLGRIPSSITSGETCPDACGLKDNGCFAEFGILAMHWREVSSGRRGLRWATFLQKVRELPEGQVWRHNTAGDLPGVGDDLDVPRFLELVEANEGRRGFTMTRKPLARPNERSAVAVANRRGFTVNVTCHGVEDFERQRARQLGAPLVVVLPHYSSNWVTTAGGGKIMVCPHDIDPAVKCESCQLCTRATRKVAVGFLAHGQWQARVNQLVELKVKAR